MKRILILSLMAIACLTMQAQTKTVKNIKVLAKPTSMYMSGYPKATIDPKTKKKTVVWHDTENNSWHENIGFVKDLPTIDNIESIWPKIAEMSEGSYIPSLWQLTEEDNETVLHCYFRMPADIVENFWLCSDECVILDRATGTIYQSRRCVPDCYGKVFSLKAKEGTTIDFQIFFPKLPDTVESIAIYGVPNWFMRGMGISFASKSDDLFGLERNPYDYDEMMPIHKAHLVSEAKDYDKDNYKTWAVYNDAHLIKPVKDDTYAIWRTKEATYLAEACEMNWMREYFGRGGNNILVDQRGHQYKCKEVLGYPSSDLFWVEGWTGDYFAIVMVFEPIPVHLETITYIEPEGEPFAMWGANWEGKVLNFSIKELRDNQKLFKYHPREVVK
ncbi:MAG: hypothetical protein IKM76_03865 [Prevotella sp.]|nr:hypothetical protein [Prevotella sp.]